MYKRVVLAYDGTVEGRSALREGALIAKRCDAQVYMLSVVPELASLRVAEGLNAGPMAQQQTTYRAVLAEGVARLKLLGFEPIAHLVAGEPTVAIGAFARQIKADLVVVGQRRPTRLARWWSGSSGNLLADNIDCSILISRNTISDDEFLTELARITGAMRAGGTPPAPADPLAGAGKSA